jgi:DNA-binding NtrC family response regulator
MAKILIIDGELELQDSLARMLKDEGYEAHGVFTAEEAIQIFDTHAIDVVVAQIDLPGQSGIELVQHIADRGLEIETILLTDTPSMESVRAATWAGAFDYLVRPVPHKTLSRVVNCATKVKSLRAQKAKTTPARSNSQLDDPATDAQFA